MPVVHMELRSFSTPAEPGVRNKLSELERDIEVLSPVYDGASPMERPIYQGELIAKAFKLHKEAEYVIGRYKEGNPKLKFIKHEHYQQAVDMQSHAEALIQFLRDESLNNIVRSRHAALELRAFYHENFRGRELSEEEQEKATQTKSDYNMFRDLMVEYRSLNGLIEGLAKLTA